jgi:hypothetical protein
MPAQFLETEDGGEYVNLHHVKKATKTRNGIALFDEVGAQLGIVSVDVWERYRTAAAQRLAKA